jgi:hypothetical protein
MKNLLFVFLLLPAMAFSYQGNPSLEAISKALSTGDVETLSKYFADNVEISIKDNEQLYSKAKATEVMRNFFNTNKPRSFQQVHQGTSRESSDQYSIGNLSSSSGNYRVYLYLKSSGGNMVIQEIRLDQE